MRTAFLFVNSKASNTKVTKYTKAFIFTLVFLRGDKKREKRMSENILIAIAWPYANAEIHVGNITGSHLPGDIVARYHRLKGNKVLMVSGTDSHGTPVTIRADQEGKPVEEVYKRFHEIIHRSFQGLWHHI